MREVRLFFAAVWQDWVSSMSGLASVLLAAAASSGYGQLPDWVFWLTAGVCFLIAAFRVWRFQFAHAEKLAGELEATWKRAESCLQIMDESGDDLAWLFSDNNRCPVRVKNLSDSPTCFHGQITNIEPMPEVPGFQLPVNLQIAGAREGVDKGKILGGGYGLVEVFAYKPDPNGVMRLCVYGATTPIPVEQTNYTVDIMVQADQGRSVSRSFALVGCKPDGLALMALPAEESSSPVPPTPIPPLPRRRGRSASLLVVMLINRIWRAFFSRNGHRRIRR